MLGLGQKIGRDKLGIGRVVGNQQRFRRAGQGIDRCRSVQLLLGQDDENVARSVDLIDVRNAFGSVRHCRDRLSTADLEHAVHTAQFSRIEDCIMDLTVLVRRCAENDFRTTRYPGRYRQHHQLGAEVMGTDDPDADVEVIALLANFYRSLGLQRGQVRPDPYSRGIPL